MKDKAGRTVYACGFAFDPQGAHVLLIEKQRPKWQAGRLNGIGGHVEEDESPIEAMAREFEEETGVDTLERDWTEFAVVLTEKSRVHMFATRLGPGVKTAKTMTDERIVVLRTDEVDIHRTVPNLSWLVPMALRAGSFLNVPEVHELAAYER